MLVSNGLFIDEEYKNDVATRIDYHDFLTQAVNNSTIYNKDTVSANTGTIENDFKGVSSSQEFNGIYYKVKGITETYGKAIPYEEYSLSDDLVISIDGEISSNSDE